MGVVVALAIRTYVNSVDRIYAFDLAGAGIGAVAVVPLLWVVDVPTLLVSLGALGGLAALMFAPGGGATKLASGVLAVVIAGLYLNRLRRGMQLAADPTIQYILPDGPRRLLYRDLEIDSPYNTYRCKGLPPGPINNPGRASIIAALNPASHDYLFFVARADGSGGHTFSRTGQEHEAAVRQYRSRVSSQ